MDYSPPTELLKKIGEAWASTDLASLEALQTELLQKRVEIAQTLAETAVRVLYPKEDKMTEMERKLRLEATLAPMMHDVELLQGLEEITKLRLHYYLDGSMLNPKDKINDNSR